MKKTIIIIYLVFIGTLSNAVADYGPYYIKDIDYCTEYELYLTPGDFIYGTEYGCAYIDNRAPSKFVGILSFEKDSFFLIESNPELSNSNFPRNKMLILEYNFYTMIATAYITNGYTFEYYADWEWAISLR
ncbi:MAG: hypothetical protein HQK62_02320 [Desulfamplus sp.]|nr:hypothetical protein [Desulfamplus sp.]MBF0257665.1 hypothetical protein [Desulfamplus sp.]